MQWFAFAWTPQSRVLAVAPAFIALAVLPALTEISEQQVLVCTMTAHTFVGLFATRVTIALTTRPAEFGALADTRYQSWRITSFLTLAPGFFWIAIVVDPAFLVKLRVIIVVDVRHGAHTTKTHLAFARSRHPAVGTIFF